MPGFKLLMNPKDICYAYDGSLGGFYCCVYESIYKKEMPMEIALQEDLGLLPFRFVETRKEDALKVRASIQSKISAETLALCETVFLTNLPHKEIKILHFLVLGFDVGKDAVHRLTDPQVAPLLEAQRFIQNEAHLLKGLIRFAEHEGKLVATITPKNFVLPMIAPHFCERYAEEHFMIYDKSHHAALVYEGGQARMGQLEGWHMPEKGEVETCYQELWKRFYHTIAIKERTNERLRMGHMPQRYWENMVEMND